MKIATALTAIAVIGLSTAAFAQNAPMPSGASNPPPGTSHSPGTSALPPSTTGTARAGALDSSNTTGAQAAAQEKFKEAGFSDVKGLSRSTDGSWSGRAVKNGVEVGVVMDTSGKIAVQ
ncbi:MAG: hypothetical protein JSR47_16920 [Proteobacteria bacterium]|nr:hypothetical protein [Pseudomonadota bacterium]